MPSDFDLAYQELIDSGLSEDEAAVKAREFTTPATDTTLLGNFIGDPADLASNTFREDARPNGISSWTPAAMQPAGEAFNVPGGSYPNRAKEFGDYGYSPEDVDKMVNIPTQIVAAGINRIEGAYNVPENTVSELKRKGESEIERRIKLVQDGLGYQEADAVTLVPWMNEVNEVAAQYRREQTDERPTYRTIPGGGVIQITPAGIATEIYAPKEKPVPNTVSVSSGPQDNRVTRRMTEDQLMQLQADELAAAPPDETIKTLLARYAYLKSKVGVGDVRAGPDWNPFASNRNQELEQTKTLIMQAGFDPETGQKIGNVPPPIMAGGELTSTNNVPRVRRYNLQTRRFE